MGSRTAEDYIRALYYLEKKNGTARQSEVARYLGVSRPGVSEMLVSLDKSGLVRRRRYTGATLTRRGRSLAMKMTFKHRVLESFLAKTLRVPAGKVHNEACQLEHAISDDTLRRLYALLGRPAADPHGQPITPC